jgi:hypothetical protein
VVITVYIKAAILKTLGQRYEVEEVPTLHEGVFQLL